MGVKEFIKEIIRATREKQIIPIETPVFENKLLVDKIAFISGGSGGLGMAIAKALLESDCKVILGGTNQNKLDTCKGRLLELFDKKLEDSIATIISDFSDTTNLDNFVEDVSSIFGKIDIFVNASGVHTENLDFWRMKPDEYDRIMNINLKGPYFTSIEMAKYWRKNGIHGHILLISSSRGSEPAWSPYGISKWATDGMTKGLAQLLIEDGIVVNAIAPGSTATPLLGKKEGDSIYCEDNKMGRMATPDEIGTYAKLLVSDAGNMLAGETIHISAGRGIFDIR